MALRRTHIRDPLFQEVLLAPRFGTWMLHPPPQPLSRRPVASALLTPSPTHHEHKDGHTAPGKHQVVADLPKEQAREDPTNHPEVRGGNQCEKEAKVWGWQAGQEHSPHIFVAQEGHQVDGGEVSVDSDQVETEQDSYNFQCQPSQCRARLQSQEVWGEPARRNDP